MRSGERICEKISSARGRSGGSSFWVRNLMRRLAAKESRKKPEAIIWAWIWLKLERFGQHSSRRKTSCLIDYVGIIFGIFFCSWHIGLIFHMKMHER